ncbi:MAG: division/cell wall cluster transcriptional repressor MraZ [Paludibacter sp.]|nr:division/cell wall cluster transcriptional repressor MraZ [Bacteroidales bacterium]MCM1068356.1 division/cell wall cluster transcriptional repressor MraZ [Prevotella sp.]MCM1354016.1 division/cell wall cluster transcriptional repressor MraZ [Bacteroides sp.]MCM1442142.1 division/cell wall cluster transcriptional repressor MraZ [Muribaculum sp.]MCM1481965.1 division/cell wall cluster transcriptional repressor MraZ [Paludibacter sp.]
MATFIGNIETKLDDKGRIFIPAAYRKILAEQSSQRLVMRRDTDNECLIVYPESVWNSKVEQLSQVLDEWNPDDQLLLMQFVADADFLEPDNQGRVLLQKRNLQSIGAEGEVLIVGMMNRFAIWNKNTFNSKRAEPAEFALRLRQKMSNKPANQRLEASQEKQ